MFKMNLKQRFVQYLLCFECFVYSVALPAESLPSLSVQENGSTVYPASRNEDYDEGNYGYTQKMDFGLSCGECVVGYERVLHGTLLGRCVPVREQCPEGTYDDVGQCRPCPCPGTGRTFGKSCYRDTDGEITCACNEGHVGRNCAGCGCGYAPNPNYPYDCRPVGARCDAAGSLSPTPDPFTQRCNYKENAVGPLCNQCKTGTFHLRSGNQFGCIKCFCMGIVTQCSSSSWYRTQERSSFFESSQGFTLVDSGDTRLTNVSVEYSGRELAYRGFPGGSGLTYYWQLPQQYLGDKATSYGGYLNYTVRYVPPAGGQTSPNTGADVELNGNDVRLLYFHRGEPLAPNRSVNLSVPLLEQFWQRADGGVANREYLLMALANLDTLLIKATYTTFTHETYLSEISLDYSISRNTGQDRAWAVEECPCPEGYHGLSCQECAPGFTRSLKGLYLGLCERCSCNRHSDICDPKTGICKNCRGFTTGEFCNECEDGYVGNPKFGDCRLSLSSQEPAQCLRFQFRCRDGTCIDNILICNGFSDCPDNTDEDATICPARTTPPPKECAFGQFRCGDGTCISQLERCQGKVDCPDSSDEEGCLACLDSFRCSTGHCIDNKYKCDGTPQCTNGDDEQNCGSTCNGDQFPCANGQCIPLLYKCDSVPDCADGTDEATETCSGGMLCAAAEFKCIAGGCIPRAKLCDGWFDCADGSDEISGNCPLVSS